MVRCEEIMGKAIFESYSEFYLALCMSAECLRLGTYMDMSSMRIDKEIIPEQEYLYFKYLMGVGAIKVEGYRGDTNPVDPSRVSIYVDTNILTDLEDVLVKDEGDCYHWFYGWGEEHYTKHRTFMLNLSMTSSIVMHIVGMLIVDMFVGRRTKKKLRITFEGNLAKSSYLYINLFSCMRTMEWFRGIADVNIDFADFKADLDYAIHFNNGYVVGRNKLYSMPEKLSLMDKFGMVVGSIVVLYTRRGMCDSNPAGRIETAKIARIDEIGKDFVSLTTIAVNKTREEVYADYLDIPEDLRHLYIDLLTNSPATYQEMISLPSLGIENYLYDENNFITVIDKYERVMKRISIEGVEVNKEMSGIDAIYWLLCQYEVDFDRELYRRMYSNSKPLMWDTYGKD